MRRSIGHIEARGSGCWKLKISLGKDFETGKYIQKWFTVRGGRKDAEKRLGELSQQYGTGEYIKPQKVTVAAYLARWLADYAKPNLSPRGYERYESICKVHLIPALGNIQLAQLRPEHLQRHYSEMLKAGLSPRTARYSHVVLHKALVTALKWRLISLNPADNVELPKVHQAEMQTWDEFELNKFLEAAKTTPYYPLFYTALFTGMRRSELLALRWQDIDFIYSQIYVNRGMHQLRDNSFIFTQPKTAKSRRTIAISPSLFGILEAYRKAKEVEAKMLGVTLSESDLVFNMLGEPLRPNTVSRAWGMLAVKANVKKIRFHDARHTHASLMLKQGIHPKVVQERLGHSSIQITLDTYSHVAPGLQEAAAKRFDEAVKVGHNDTTIK